MRANSTFQKSCRFVPTARQRLLHTTCSLRSESPTKFTNILAGANALTTQVKAVEREGLHLEDGRIVKGPCIFLEGKVFLWNVPPAWEGWKEEHFDIFKVVVPKPALLLFGTGKKTVLPPGSIRKYLVGLGMTTEFMDTRSACSTYNLLAEEGRRVAAALLPNIPYNWKKGAFPSVDSLDLHMKKK